MYSVGYAGYYAMSLLTFEPMVLFVSLGAHMMQFGFLTFFEEGHIERVYGGGLRKPLAARVPFEVLHEERKEEGEGEGEREQELETPGLTSDGGDEGGEETEIEFETEEEEQEEEEEDQFNEKRNYKSNQTTRTSNPHRRRRPRTLSTSSYDSLVQPSQSQSSTSPPIRNMSKSASFKHKNKNQQQQQRVTRHDLDNTWFRKDLLIFKNFDPFR